MNNVGKIPCELGQLERLERLRLHQNRLTGTLCWRGGPSVSVVTMNSILHQVRLSGMCWKLLGGKKHALLQECPYVREFWSVLPFDAALRMAVASALFELSTSTGLANTYFFLC